MSEESATQTNKSELTSCEGHSAIYQEHSPFYALLTQIPFKVHRGVSVLATDLRLTCMTSQSRFIALGTNVGLVYWYDRLENELTRLWCPDRETPISAIALVETVEFLLAAGDAKGKITIFQVVIMN